MTDDDIKKGPFVNGQPLREMMKVEEYPGTGLQPSITLSRQEVVALFCYEEGVIPDGEQRKIGFRWKTPIKGEDEVRPGKKETWLRYWRVGEFIDIGRDDIIGIAWRPVKIEGSPYGRR